MLSRDTTSEFAVKWSANSQNLRLKTKAGLRAKHREKTKRFYNANRKALKPIEPVLRTRWEEDLQHLKETIKRLR